MPNPTTRKQSDTEFKSLLNPQWPIDLTQNPVKKKPMNLKILQSLMEKEHGSLVQAEGKNSVLLLGLTGAGKSTIANYLKGLSMTLKENPDTGDEYLEIDDPSQHHAKMSDGIDSATLAPNVAPWEKLSPQACLIDAPGFEDNRGDEYKACAKLMTHAVIQWSRSVSAVCVVIDSRTLDTTRGEGFGKLIDSLSLIFDNYQKLGGSFVFLMNFSRRTKQQLNNRIKLFHDRTKKQLMEKKQSFFDAAREKKAGAKPAIFPQKIVDLQKSLSVLSLMVEHPDHIVPVNPTDDGTSRQNILSLLRTLKPIDRANFILPESDDEQIQFRYLLTGLFQFAHGLLQVNQDDRHALEKTQNDLQQTGKDLKDTNQQLQEAKTGTKVKAQQLKKHACDTQMQSLEKEARHLEREIATIQEKSASLNLEKLTLDDPDAQVTYWEKTIRVPSLSFTGAIGVGLAAGAAYASGVGLVAGAASVVAGGGAGAALGWDHAEKSFEYPLSVPYQEVIEWTVENSGIEIKPDASNSKEEGIYKATFIPSKWVESKAKVTIKGPKNKKPENVNRLKAIKAELDDLRTSLETLISRREEINHKIKLLTTEQAVLDKELAEKSITGQQSAAQIEQEKKDMELAIQEHKALASRLKENIAALSERSQQLAGTVQSTTKQLKADFSFLNFLSHLATHIKPASPEGVRFNTIWQKESQYYRRIPQAAPESKQRTTPSQSTSKGKTAPPCGGSCTEPSPATDPLSSESLASPLSTSASSTSGEERADGDQPQRAIFYDEIPSTQSGDGDQPQRAIFYDEIPQAQQQ